ncbi:MAG: hypothetical protein R6U44_02295 [Archaeoglobaceae archaeon]
MGIVDELKKKLQGDPHQMVEVLVDEIDRLIASSWSKIDEKRVGGRNGERSDYEFLYQSEWDKVEVEMNYNPPYIEIAVRSPKKMMEHRITVSEFVEKKVMKVKLKNQEELEKMVKGLINKIEER